MSLLQEASTLKQIYKGLDKSGDKLVVVKFHHAFCYACQKVKPKFKKLMPKFSKDARFYEVEVADVADSVDRFKITKIPTFVAFHRKKELNRYVGYDGENLAKFLTKSLSDKQAVEKASSLEKAKKSVIKQQQQQTGVGGIGKTVAPAIRSAGKI